MELERDFLLAADPARLFEQATGETPDPWQIDALRSPAREQIWLCSRQAGKSSTAAVAAAHTAMYQPGSLTLLFSPGIRQSSELLAKVKGVIQAVGGDLVEGDSQTKMELANGSRVISLPGTPDTTRGYSAPALVVVDEAGWADDELYDAIRPLLAIGHGRLILISTPNGQRGFFFEAWEHGGDGWHRIKVTADDCPRITPDFLENERQRLTERTIQSEYYCVFNDQNAQVFGSELAKSSITDEVEPLFGGALEW